MAVHDASIVAVRPSSKRRIAIGVVLGRGAVRVAERRAPCEHVLDRHVLAHDPARGLDAVAAHVQERAAARRLDVPEVLGVRPRVALAGAHRQHPPEGARVDQLPELHDLGAEHLVLEVAVEDAGVGDEAQHLGRLVAGPAERLRAEHALARGDRGADCVEMQVVRERDHDQVDGRVGASPAIVS